MKAFVKKLVIFLAPLLLMGYPLDVFISTNLKKANEYAEKEYPTWNAVFEGKVNSDIVIYGSSRAWVHFDASLMTSRLNAPTYNLGIDGQNFELQYLRHKLLLEKNKKPELIIVSLDVFTFQKKPDLYNSEQFLPYMLWNKEIKDATVGYNGFTASDYNVPLLRYYGKYDAVKTAIGLFSGSVHNPITRVRGYEGRNESWNSDFDKAKATMKKMEVTIDTSTVALFNKFLKECKSENIKLLFVYTPQYIEGQDFVKNKNQIMELFKNLAKANQIPFYDYSKDILCYDKKYFYNSNHLNKVGSELFTNKLIDTILKSDYWIAMRNAKPEKIH